MEIAAQGIDADSGNAGEVQPSVSDSTTVAFIAIVPAAIATATAAPAANAHALVAGAG